MFGSLRSLLSKSPPLVVGAFLLWTTPAAADLLALEPGKRIVGHQGIDCDKCHTSGSGVSRDKCLGCHEHTPLAKRIAAKEGLHARRDFAKSCETCHQDHKGASFDPINWAPLGGQKR
ncbi:MAG: cytochrome c3 family protein, partial [Myxococcota bacterium]